MCCRKCRTFGFVVLCLAWGIDAQVRASELESWSASSSLRPGDLSREWVANDNPLNTTVAMTHESEKAFYALTMELGKPAVEASFNFPGDDDASPLLGGKLLSNPDPNDNAAWLVSSNRSSGDADGSEWDYLWVSPSCVPVGSIPEPTSTSLLVGGVILMCASRTGRKRAR